LNEHYFASEIDKARNELKMNSPEMEQLKDMNMPEFERVVGTIKNGFAFVGSKISN
jgi:hypothetical protein